ncbi:deoxyribonuclease-1 [Plakobranchus ocellatus]|uniref:Deoxyribonuclease-1 n=1 Tax=Plakobranchus ocellatus TaxID=259542 RepID=A0AAV4CMV2_9GAST|nr:deoxyribonuclease-1 [Plakobranchus ocellatus]
MDILRAVKNKHCNYSKTAMMIGGAVVSGIVIATIILVPVLSSMSKKNYQNNVTRSHSSDSHATTQHPPLFVAAFNIKSFGDSKSQNKLLLRKIVQIISRYDVALLQEVRDQTSGKALKNLWQGLNATGSAYGLVHSKYLGRSSYKEQYAFFYRIGSAELTDTLQYDDSAHDIFEREPYTAEFTYYSTKGKRRKRIAFMALHAKPKEAKRELKELPSVMKLTLNHFRHSHGIIAMGDFNADCSYLSNKRKGDLEIFKVNGSFKSLIDHSADTTVASTTDCAYDRAVAYPNSVGVMDAKVFDFQKAFHLSEAEAKKVSDHFPIEFKVL